jgi:dienelactone hydrolase
MIIMVRILSLLLGVLIIATSVEGAVQSRSVTYKHGDTNCIGYLAWDDSVEGPRPGVLVFSEFWGLDAYAKRRADQLAKLGYVAFAADLYGEGKLVDHPQDASAMAGKIRSNVDDWKKRGLEALDVLKAQPQCDKTKIAAIGYCLGGSTAQQLAFSGADLKAVVSFHGALVVPNPEQVKAIKAAVLICHGADDSFIPPEKVKEFRDALDKNGGKYTFSSYEGARHSFTVPEADATAQKFKLDGLRYNKAADDKSWSEMQALFKQTLGK